MKTKSVARCSIYEKRPELCRKYPQIYHYTPEECTFWFAGSERLGSCECDVGACCATPREKGEPGGAPLPDSCGGLPCKHLVWENVMEKEASAAVGGTLSEADLAYAKWAVDDAYGTD